MSHLGIQFFCLAVFFYRSFIPHWSAEDIGKELVLCSRSPLVKRSFRRCMHQSTSICLKKKSLWRIFLLFSRITHYKFSFLGCMLIAHCSHLFGRCSGIVLKKTHLSFTGQSVKKANFKLATFWLIDSGKTKELQQNFFVLYLCWFFIVSKDPDPGPKIFRL